MSKNHVEVDSLAFELQRYCIVECEITLHVGHTTLKFSNVDDLMKFADKIKGMEVEIQENLD